MMNNQFSITFLFVVQLLCATTTAATIGGCSPQSVSKGLYAEYIKLTEDYSVATAKLATVALTVIDKSEAEYSWGGVTSQNFYFADRGASAVNGDLYGKTVNVGHFGLRLSGYFYASTTGVYTFEISYVDDAASITLGAGVAMDCCGSEPLTGNVDENAYLIGDDKSTTATEKVTLTAGAYYPIKMVYYQGGKKMAEFNMSVLYPDGTNHTTDIDWYSSTDNSTSCPYSTTTTIIWTGSDTETFTETASD
ncbi:hypothetical protein CANTEDRAFT_92688, partial [Yamadazyma tenuis ATCC 10573]